MVSWYVAYTQPRKERQAAQHLRNQAFNVFLPLCRKTRRHAGRVEVTTAPLFPRYVFVGVDMAHQRWRAINGTIGVHSLVMSGDAPLPVPEAVLSDIRVRQDNEGIVRLTPPSLRRGQAVRIAHGAMADTRALFEETVDANRALLLVMLLGRFVRVEISADMIEAA
jgi:transcriptional antiterminator RfaH